MGGRLPNPVDRRVQRTQAALRDALVTLIAERGWDGFSVQDVCDRANVGRSTFYTHFADKEELIGGAFEELKRFLRSQVGSVGDGPPRPLAFSRGLVDHAWEQRRLFVAVVGKRSGHLVQRKFRDAVLALVREDLDAALPAGPKRGAAAAFLGGALLELLTWWLEAKSPLPPETVDGLFHELAAPVLAVAGYRR
ncbi:MAG TPA: TetR/AcrR family transcriptional regulator [Anaeromyxobacteraceae bacterium]|nr:TetR/AcrR family transcriptional regulator [Anaeromyxobacteraceae bacterium]